MEQIEMSLRFDFEDIEEAQEFFSHHLGEYLGGRSTEAHHDDRERLIDADLILSFMKDVIPVVVPIILLWLGL
jgi:hypothetical protein